LPVAALLLWLVIAAGVGFRLNDFAGNRSLWRDEASVALNILDRPFEQLLQPLDDKQAAPPFFLWAEKCASLVFGMNEFALRLVPLAFGLFSIPLFCLVARQYLGKWQNLLATALFAIGEPLVRYSTEVKQYSGDVFFILAIYWCVQWFMQQRTLKRGLLLGLLGGVAAWFSYPASFALAGACVFLVGRQLKRKRPWFLTVLPILVWAAAVVALVFLQLLAMAPNRPLLDLYGRSAFVPAQLSKVLPWFGAVGDELFAYSFGLGFDPSTSWYGAALMLAGGLWLHRKSSWDFWLLASPAVIVTILAGAHLYPLVGRLLLFLAPAGLIFIARAFSPGRHAVWYLACACMAIVVLWQPVERCMANSSQPRSKEELRPAFAYLLGHWQPGDKLYVYYGATAAFYYYRKLNDWREAHVLIGNSHRRNRSLYARELKRLAGGKRVWVLMSHEYWQYKNNQLEREYFVQTLDRLGTRKDAQTYEDADLFLYDLSDAADPAFKPEVRPVPMHR